MILNALLFLFLVFISDSSPRSPLYNQKAVLSSATMPEEMQEDAINFTRDALRRYPKWSEAASRIKHHFNRKYNPTWHCIIGKEYSLSVDTEENRFINFYIGETHITLFKDNS